MSAPERASYEKQKKTIETIRSNLRGRISSCQQTVKKFNGKVQKNTDKHKLLNRYFTLLDQMGGKQQTANRTLPYQLVHLVTVCTQNVRGLKELKAGLNKEFPGPLTPDSPEGRFVQEMNDHHQAIEGMVTQLLEAAQALANDISKGYRDLAREHSADEEAVAEQPDEMEQLRTLVAQLQQELADLKQSHETEMTARNEELGRLRQELANEKAKNEALLRENQELKQAGAHKDATIQSLTSGTTNAASTIAERDKKIESQQAELRKLREENARLRQENSQLQAQLKDAQATIGAQARRIHELEAENQQLRKALQDSQADRMGADNNIVLIRAQQQQAKKDAPTALQQFGRSMAYFFTVVPWVVDAGYRLFGGRKDNTYLHRLMNKPKKKGVFGAFLGMFRKEKPNRLTQSRNSLALTYQPKFEQNPEFGTGDLLRRSRTVDATRYRVYNPTSQAPGGPQDDGRNKQNRRYSSPD